MKSSRPSHSCLSIILFLILLVFLWIVSGWNTDNSDMDNYIKEYEWAHNLSSSLNLHFGYGLIEYFCIQLGFDYYQYRIFIYGIGLFLYGVTIYRWSPNIILMLFFFIVIHFLRDVVETRNFIASIFIFLLIEAMGRENKSHKLYTALLIFLAFSVHMAFISCFVFLLTEKKKWNYWKLLLLSALFSIVFRRVYMSGGLYTIANMFDGGEEKLNEVNELIPRFAVYLSIALAVFNGLCLMYFNNLINVNPAIKEYRIRHLTIEKYSFIINNMNALSNFIIIFTVINGAFLSRTFVNITLLNLIYFLSIIHCVKERRSFSIIVIFIYVSIYTYFLQITPFQYHLLMVFGNNELF